MHWLLESSNWPARRECGVWPLELVWAMVVSNLVITACYLTLPVGGWWILRRKPNLAPDKVLAVLSLVFVVLCGMTHAVDAAMFYWPGYHLNLVARWATAVVSAVTVWRLWAVRRVIARFASPAEYEAVIRDRDAALATSRQREQAVAVIAARQGVLFTRLQIDINMLQARLDLKSTRAELADIQRILDDIREAVVAPDIPTSGVPPDVTLGRAPETQ